MNFYSKKTYYWLLGSIMFISIIASIFSIPIIQDIIVVFLIVAILLGYVFYLYSLFIYFKNCNRFFETEIIDLFENMNDEVQVLKISISSYKEPLSSDSFSFKPIIKFGGYIQDSYDQYREVLIQNKANGVESTKLVKITIEFNNISSINIHEI